jgi:Spy/CpxP family protein refolding chaperone
MKTFLGISVVAAVVAIAAGLYAAGDGAAPKAGARWPQVFRQAKMTVIAQKLGLTSDQRAKLKAIRGETAEAVKAIQANSALTPEQKHAQVAAARHAGRAQMGTVLTDEQKGRLALIRSHPARLNDLAAQRVKRSMVANRLGLSPDQRTRIRDISTKTAAAVKSTRTDASLTPEAKHERMRQLAEASRTELRGILTPEQQTRLNRMRRRLLAPLGRLG